MCNNHLFALELASDLLLDFMWGGLRVGSPMELHLVLEDQQRFLEGVKSLVLQLHLCCCASVLRVESVVLGPLVQVLAVDLDQILDVLRHILCVLIVLPRENGHTESNCLHTMPTIYVESAVKSHHFCFFVVKQNHRTLTDLSRQEPDISVHFDKWNKQQHVSLNLQFYVQTQRHYTAVF